MDASVRYHRQRALGWWGLLPKMDHDLCEIAHADSPQSAEEYLMRYSSLHAARYGAPFDGRTKMAGWRVVPQDQWVDFVATSARADLLGVAAMRYTQPISPGWGWSLGVTSKGTPYISVVGVGGQGVYL